MTAQVSVERLLTVADVSDLIQVAATFVYRHAAELGAIKVGSHLRFRREDLERRLAAKKLGNGAGDCRISMDNRIASPETRAVGRRSK